MLNNLYDNSVFQHTPTGANPFSSYAAPASTGFLSVLPGLLQSPMGLAFGVGSILAITFVGLTGIALFSSDVPPELGLRARLAFAGEKASDSLSQWMPSLGGDPSLRPEPGWSADHIRSEYASTYEALATLETLSNDEKKQLGQRLETLQRLAPGLKPLIRLHRAEVYQSLPDEAATQYQLHAVIADGNPSLVNEARYRLGQSHLRASEWEKAQEQFSTLQEKSPKSEQAIAANYYLATLANQNQHDGTPYYRAYLINSPQGRFASDCATQWLSQKTTPISPNDRPLIAMGLLQGNDAHSSATSALAALVGAPLSPEAFLAAGNAYSLLNQSPQALTSYQRALLGNPSEAVLRKTVAALIKTGTPQQQTAVLSTVWKALASQRPAGGDAILWQLSRLNESQAKGWLSQLASLYPQSRYAAEATWQTWWQQWVHTRSFSNALPHSLLQQAEAFLQRYPQARSAANMAFWLAKSYENSDPAKATATYQRLAKDYPWTYYAFRAQQRLHALKSGKDSGWQLSNTTHFKMVSSIPLRPFPVEDTASNKELSAATSMLQSLRAIIEQTHSAEVLSDALLLLSPLDTSYNGEISPSSKRILNTWLAWQAQWDGKPARSIQIIREGLQDIASKETTSPADALNTYRPTPTELGLLYPTPYINLLNMSAEKSSITPWLSLAIMREESHFNPNAISSSNALGLMQLLPSTAAEVAGWEGLLWGGASSLYLPETNIRLGSRYLAFLQERFKSYGPVIGPMLGVGAYNGGPNAMARWASSENGNTLGRWLKIDPDVFVEQIPYEQTRTYVKKVYTSIWTYQTLSER